MPFQWDMFVRFFQGMAFVALRFALRSFQGCVPFRSFQGCLAVMVVLVAAPSARAATASSRTRRSIVVWSCAAVTVQLAPWFWCSWASCIIFLLGGPSVFLC